MGNQPLSGLPGCLRSQPDPRLYTFLCKYSINSISVEHPAKPLPVIHPSNTASAEVGGRRGIPAHRRCIFAPAAPPGMGGPFAPPMSTSSKKSAKEQPDSSVTPEAYARSLRLYARYTSPAVTPSKEKSYFGSLLFVGILLAEQVVLAVVVLRAVVEARDRLPRRENHVRLVKKRAAHHRVRLYSASPHTAIYNSVTTRRRRQQGTEKSAETRGVSKPRSVPSPSHVQRVR